MICSFRRAIKQFYSIWQFFPPYTRAAEEKVADSFKVSLVFIVVLQDALPRNNRVAKVRQCFLHTLKCQIPGPSYNQCDHCPLQGDRVTYLF
mgnify:FL=1